MNHHGIDEIFGSLNLQHQNLFIQSWSINTETWERLEPIKKSVKNVVVFQANISNLVHRMKDLKLVQKLIFIMNSDHSWPTECIDMKNIQELQVCKNLSILRCISTDLNQLEVLKILGNGFNNYDVTYASNFISNCHSLKVLEISKILILRFSKWNFSSLEKLVLEEVKIDFNYLHFLLSTSRNSLKNLSLVQSEEFAYQIVTDLSVINLTHLEISLRLVKNMTKYPNSCEKITNLAIWFDLSPCEFSKEENLSELFESFEFLISICENVENLSLLEKINIGRNQIGFCDYQNVLETISEKLPKLKVLKIPKVLNWTKLNLNFEELEIDTVSDHDFEVFVYFLDFLKKLKFLKINELKKFNSRKLFEILKNLPNIEEIYLGVNIDVTESLLKSIQDEEKPLKIIGSLSENVDLMNNKIFYRKSPKFFTKNFFKQNSGALKRNCQELIEKLEKYELKLDILNS